VNCVLGQTAKQLFCDIFFVPIIQITSTPAVPQLTLSKGRQEKAGSFCGLLTFITHQMEIKFSSRVSA
jgi:hypothetical protein